MKLVSIFILLVGLDYLGVIGKDDKSPIVKSLLSKLKDGNIYCPTCKFNDKYSDYNVHHK